MAKISDRSIERTGGVGKDTNSARAGLLPISLERAPLGAFEGIPVYLGARDKSANAAAPRFTLYCSDQIPLTRQRRENLSSHGVKFVYIPISDQERFRHQAETTLLQTMDDPDLLVSAKCEILYETSVALINELLTDPASIGGNPRLQKVSQAVTMLALNEPKTFSHLFATSHHDFYTATHMVNVGTWMVPLACAVGHNDPQELERICLAGLLHDVGKTRIPAAVLNKKGKLSEQEWKLIKLHPAMGCDYLQKNDVTDLIVLSVARQHHERMTGGGYPDKLLGDAIHPVSRICAVIDSFDAMTAMRPFKDRTMSVAQALKILTDETPEHYDAKVLEAWLGLLKGAEEDGMLGESLGSDNGPIQRQFARFRINCPVRFHVLQASSKNWVEQPGLDAKAHNISQSGAGLLCNEPVRVNETVRIHLLGRGTLRRTYEGVTLRCRSFEDGWYDVGIRLFAAVDAGDISELAVA